VHGAQTGHPVAIPRSVGWTAPRQRGRQGSLSVAPQLIAASIGAWLVFAPADRDRSRDRGRDLDLAAEGLDPAAVEAGLRARVGEVVDDWSIRVVHEGEDEYRVVLRRRGTRADRRTVTLVGPSREDRSRELAAILAVILDEDPQSSEPASSEAPPLYGFVAVDTQLTIGRPRDPDPGYGLGLTGGAWLLGDHLQPRARVGWQHGWAGALEVHQVQLGLGLAAGAPIRARYWIGVLALPTVEWTQARQIQAASVWAGGAELSLLGQARWGPLIAGLRTGVDLSFPATRAAGTREEIRWGHLRWLLAFELGFGFGR
jgi:hypothetical protein